MKNKSLIFSAIFIVLIGFVTLVFNSCEKNKNDLSKKEVITNEGIALMNGALNFESADMFFETSEKLGEMSRIERDEWEESIGFTSMRKELNDILDEVAACDDDCEISNIVLQNSDLVKIQNDNVLPIIESQAYAAISNRNGIFYVEGVIHKVAGSKIASSEDGEEETVSNALTSVLKSTTTGVNVIEYINNSSLKSGCGTRMSAYKEYSKRKCDFEIKTYRYYCSGCCGNYYYQVKAESKIRNYKKNWRGKWKSYNTSCEMRDRGYTISVPIVTGYNGTSSVFHYSDVTQTFSYSGSGYDCATMTRWGYVGSKVQNIFIKAPSFSRVKGKATNRGIGDRWAVINCGAW